jgi:hypothetical protein
MIKKLLLSLIIISAVGAAGITATQALLSDQAVLSANSFSTGTADLLVAKGQTGGSYQDSQSGFTSTFNFLRLKNNSSDVNFIIAAQALNTSGSIAASDVTITFTPVNSSEVAVGSPVTHSLSEWSTSPESLGTPNINSGETQEYQMDVTLSPSVSSTGTATFDFTFTGTQTP